MMPGVYPDLLPPPAKDEGTINAGTSPWPPRALEVIARRSARIESHAAGGLVRNRGAGLA